MREHLAATATLALIAAMPAWGQTTSAGEQQADTAPAGATDQAQADSAGAIGDIVVTARKRAERLRDVPIAASVVDASDIARRGGLQGVKDLVTTVPSVAFGDTSTPLTSEISIRGSGTSRGTSADSGVGLYRDGAFVGGGAQGGRTYSRFDLFDVSQIEVLRGTQGALYGRDAVGGAINIITARPTQERTGYMSFSGGNNGFVEFGGVVNEPLTEHLAARFSTNIMYQQKGFFYNPELGNYVDSQSTYAYRAQLRYENGAFDANLMGEHASNKYPALNLQYWVDPSASAPKGIYIEPMFIRHANFENLDTDRVNDIEFTSHYKFGFGTLTWISLWRDRRDLQQFDSDLLTPSFVAEIAAAGLLAPGASLGEINGTQQNRGHTRSFNQELYISGDFGGHWKWLAGAEYLHLDDDSNITATRTPTKASPSAGTVTISAQQLRSWAAYGSLEYDFQNGFDVTGQVRYTNDSKSFQTNQFDLTTATAVPGKLIDAHFNPTNISWDATASYKFSPEWMGYLKAGTGFRAGGFNSNLGVPQQPIPIPVSYGNENTLSYEVGAKGNLSRGLYVTLAAYYTDVTNLIIQVDNGCRPTNAVCPRAPTPFATDGGKARLYGVEAEATVRLALAGGMLAGTFGGSFQEGKITAGIYDGDAPPQLPHYLTSANLNYSHPVTPDTTAFVNLVYSGRFGGVQEIAQTPDLHDYQIFNARLGARQGPLELSAWANNLFNTTYITMEATSVRRWSQPRTYGLQLTFKW
ncbi:TonB-dependent receptor [Sphingomonas sp. CL5.1]|uniref:TonB-dependent receptor n=1 Tax=Sphingomonas sp. CL5.1 TaxID=2653203 RepID=UPI001582E7C6|nr:TonB-dependent receptor [Sphingomonas sp. CL5.1]QKS00493.1 TonB-dependent receptor [Sphingomonas sp. CL5.1]